MAQYAASASGSTTAAAEINSKPATQVGSGAPSGNCTAGKDFYLDSGPHTFYACTQTNTWSALATATGKITATFLLCAGGCYVGETTNWKWTAPFALTFTGCVIDAVTYPTGTGSLTVDLLKAGTTTIFSGAVPTLAGGSSAYATDTGMAAGAAMTQGQYLIASVLAVSGTLPGQFVNLVCTATY
jgi:hypothetical protein